MGPQGLADTGLSVSRYPEASEKLIIAMPQNPGKKITLFLVDGEPDGLKTLELGGWNGIGIVFPKNKLREFASNEYAGKSGVYFLFGRESEDSCVSTAYIGHASNVIDRLNTHNHDRGKEFWYRTVVFVSKDDSLTTTHARYIESRCLSLAREAKHFGYRISNSNEPTLGNLPEVEIPATEGFLENIRLLLATIGYPILQKVEAKAAADTENPLFSVQTRDGSAKGTARMTNEGFIVYKGSTIKGKQAEAVADRNKRLIAKLSAEGIIEKNGGGYVFVGDYSFTTSSAAGALILGRSANGWIIWKTAEGKTLAEVYRKGL